MQTLGSFFQSSHTPKLSDSDIGTKIKISDRKEICLGLSKVLADSYMLYLKTHNYHWNVTGRDFFQLHSLFEIQYLELATAVDLIAERIRALGVFVPATFRQFSNLSAIHEDQGIPNSESMIRNLVQGHETIVVNIKSFSPYLSKSGDEVSRDLLTQRMFVHEKTAWMLRSLLADESRGNDLGQNQLS